MTEYHLDPDPDSDLDPDPDPDPDSDPDSDPDGPGNDKASFKWFTTINREMIQTFKRKHVAL